LRDSPEGIVQADLVQGNSAAGLSLIGWRWSIWWKEERIDLREGPALMIIPIADTAVQLPAPVLRPFITQYAGFRVSGLPSGVHFGLPSSDVRLIISLGHPIEVVQMPNSMQRPSVLTALVSGLQEAPAVIRQDRDAFGLHVFIKPLGVRAILGVASREISSLVLDLSDIWGNRAESLVETLLGAHSWRERFSVLDQAFVSRLTRFSPQPEICWAWGRLAKSHGSVTVHHLADEIGYSRRYFSERFRETIGVAPKLAARVFRFKRACRLMADNRLGLAHVAIRCGYCDQAHLTHEWYAFAGCSPKTWLIRELPFLQDYELGGHDNESHDLESQKSEYDDSPYTAKR
jgi:AraC-like DNA-binding protein